MMVIGQDHALSQLAATLEFADVPATACRILLFSDVSAATGSTPAGAPLATIELAKPCGTITDGALTLHPAAPGGSMVLANQAGKEFAVSKGLFGYVLAGRMREWRLPVARDAALEGPLAIVVTVNAKALVARNSPSP